MISSSILARVRAARCGFATVALVLSAFATGLVSAQTVTGTWSPTSTTASQPATLSLAYAGFATQNLGYRFRVYFNSAQLTFVSAASSTPPASAYQGDSGVLADALNGDADAATNSYVELIWADFGNAWPTSPAGALGTLSFTTSAAFAGTSVNLRESSAGALVRNVPGSSAALTLFVAPVPTAPTISPLTNATLTGGTGSVPVNVATAGIATASVALACTIPAGTAAFTVTSGGARTINAPATVGANSPAIGLTCVPQATSQIATLTCAQTATPGPNPPSLTSTITCPAAAPSSITYTATPTTLTFAGVTAGTPTATQSVTVAANAANTAALNVASCAFGGANAADFSFSPAQTFPQSVAAGASAALPVRFTPAAADSAARSATLTCQTPNATAAGATSFVVTLNGTNPAPVPIVITPTTPAGNVVLPALTIGATPAFVTTGLNFSVSGGAATLTCVVAGAGYTATGSPLSLVVGTTRTLTVTYTGATAGTFTGTLTCTSTAPATGGPFVYNLSTTVQAAPAIGPTVQVPTIGAFGLGLLGLLIAGFAGWVQRRQVK